MASRRVHLDGQALKLYLDGNLRSQSAISFLPVVNLATFQLGADGAGSSLDAVIDELRISDVERTAQEIQQSFFLRWSSLTCPCNVSHEYLTNLGGSPPR